jgi:GxxExxY protein
MTQPTSTPTNLPSPEFTGKIIKVLYDTYNELGFGYQEKYYYRAIRLKLTALGLTVQEQLLTKILVENKIIGRYFLDFLVSDGKELVVLELKVADQVYPQHVRQVLGYLKANDLKLGMIGVFTTQGVKIKRVIN